MGRARESHPPKTAAGHMTTEVPRVRTGTTAREAIAAAVGASHDVATVVCVLGEGDRLVGVARLPDLLAVPPDRAVEEVLAEGVVPVRPGTSQEHVAHAALRSRLSTVPVVDADGRLCGVVPSLALLDVLYEEHVEDIHRLAGIRREGRIARHALVEPPARRARHRLPWLLVGLAGSALAALVVARFEEVLAAHVAVAFFVPGIVYLADAIGTQTEAIAVRAFSFGVPPLPRVLWGELRTGLWIGTVLGTLVLPAVALTTGDLRLGLAVAVSLFAAGALATGIGLVLPWWLWRHGRDPAFGSGPLATVIQDVLSLLVYFAIATALVGV